MFSKTCEYGIKAVVFVAGKAIEGEKTSLKDVAGAIESPIAYTSKILQQLAHANIISTYKGPTGGYNIAKQTMKDVRLEHIVNAIDGDSIYEGCGLGFHKCSDDTPCPVHNHFTKIRENLRQMLESTSVYDLALKLKKGEIFLKCECN